MAELRQCPMCGVPARPASGYDSVEGTTETTTDQWGNEHVHTATPTSAVRTCANGHLYRVVSTGGECKLRWCPQSVPQTRVERVEGEGQCCCII
jgi:hypothetical protein